MKNSEITSIKTSFNWKKITSSTIFEVTEVWKASVIEASTGGTHLGGSCLGGAPCTWVRSGATSRCVVPPVGGFGREPQVGGTHLGGSDL